MSNQDNLLMAKVEWEQLDALLFIKIKYVLPFSKSLSEISNLTFSFYVLQISQYLVTDSTMHKQNYVSINFIKSQFLLKIANVNINKLHK